MMKKASERNGYPNVMAKSEKQQIDDLFAAVAQEAPKQPAAVGASVQKQAEPKKPQTAEAAKPVAATKQAVQKPVAQSSQTAQAAAQKKPEQAKPTPPPAKPKVAATSVPPPPKRATSSNHVIVGNNGVEDVNADLKRKPKKTIVKPQTVTVKDSKGKEFKAKISLKKSILEKQHHEFTEKDDPIILDGLDKHLTLTSIARMVGCCRNALSDYIRSNKVLSEAASNSRDEFDDKVEQVLFDKIFTHGDTNALFFYMQRRMRHRGYGDHQVVEQKGDAQRIVIGHVKVPDKLPDYTKTLGIQVARPASFAENQRFLRKKKEEEAAKENDGGESADAPVPADAEAAPEQQQPMQPPPEAQTPPTPPPNPQQQVAQETNIMPMALPRPEIQTRGNGDIYATDREEAEWADMDDGGGFEDFGGFGGGFM